MTVSVLRRALAAASVVTVICACGGAVEKPSLWGPCGAYHDLSCINDEVHKCEWHLAYDSNLCTNGGNIGHLETTGCYQPCNADGDCGPGGRCVATGYVQCPPPCYSNVGACSSGNFCFAR